MQTEKGKDFRNELLQVIEPNILKINAMASQVLIFNTLKGDSFARRLKRKAKRMFVGVLCILSLELSLKQN